MRSAFRLVILLIGLRGERGVIRYAAVVDARLCLMTAASGGICTYIAGRVFKSARTPKTAAALTPSLDQRRQGSKRWLLELLLVGFAKGNKVTWREGSPFITSYGNWPAGPPEAPPGYGRNALRRFASLRKNFEVRTSGALVIETHK